MGSTEAAEMVHAAALLINCSDGIASWGWAGQLVGCSGKGQSKSVTASTRAGRAGATACFELIGLRAGLQTARARGSSYARGHFLIAVLRFFFNSHLLNFSVLDKSRGEGDGLVIEFVDGQRFELMIGIGRARVWVRMVMIKRTHGCWFCARTDEAEKGGTVYVAEEEEAAGARGQGRLSGLQLER
ncbi:hypothetical protein M0R45_009036 [Rubus argutus]|uniref:Uncharacterized protein n=1 Tax=Rubus argutus TaxID=59490 RepID=A0AAW1Y3C8_RUBAR